MGKEEKESVVPSFSLVLKSKSTVLNESSITICGAGRRKRRNKNVKT
jgi:hypothetical protein